jgi:predicted ATPase
MTEQVFVAREEELQLLQQVLEKALNGHGQVCFIVGEAGKGKTALLTEFACHAQKSHSDLLVAIGNCNAQTGIGDAYLPFREVLSMLTGDVEVKLAQGGTSSENARRLRAFFGYTGQTLVEFAPDLIDLFVPGSKLITKVGTFLAEKVGWLDRLEKLTKQKAIAPGELDQARIFEQYTTVLQVMAAKKPLLLILDDLQWADVASLSLLFHLGRQIGQNRILIVGAYRPEEVALGRGNERHPLEKVIAELKRYCGDIGVDLDQTGEAEGRHFVDALLDVEPNKLGEKFRQLLFRHTGGHPLFTIELLRDMQERGDIVQDEQGCWVDKDKLDRLCQYR